MFEDCVFSSYYSENQGSLEFALEASTGTLDWSGVSITHTNMSTNLTVDFSNAIAQSG